MNALSPIFLFISLHHNMDERRQRALKKYHQCLQTGLLHLVGNFLPVFRLLLTEVEYSCMDGREDNIARVAELIKILLTKENRHFDGFCSALEENGYEHWAKKIRGRSRSRRLA